ncbi:MAG: N-acetylmuramoyl-L-alanine amidase [Flavobacteriaceae bacterium]|nr:N-acetylmuramoyl-L-alanine amidase [Flavobacteriaceae bacterium]
MFKKIIKKWFSTLFLVFFIGFLPIQNFYAQQKPFVVVLDAGHGGKDPGKVGYRGIKEKDIALKITLKVGRLLTKQGVKVIYTRKTDKFVDLHVRGRIANKAKANLFVSIHCNAHHSQAHGAETWVLGANGNRKNFEVAKAENKVILMEDNYKVRYKGFDPNSPASFIGLTLLQEDYLDQSIQLASIIQENFKNIRRVNRGVKQNIFIVLHQTYMPSVLIETGFITNRTESKFLKSSYGQNKMAKSISSSILKYIRQLNANSIAIETPPPPTKKTTKNTKGVTYKVQLAFGKKISTKSYNFKGLRNIQREKAGRYYKYYYGVTSSYNTAKRNLRTAKKKGYKSAYIVAFKNGKKVKL